MITIRLYAHEARDPKAQAARKARRQRERAARWGGLSTPQRVALALALTLRALAGSRYLIEIETKPARGRGRWELTDVKVIRRWFTNPRRVAHRFASRLPKTQRVGVWVDNGSGVVGGPVDWAANGER